MRSFVGKIIKLLFNPLKRPWINLDLPFPVIFVNLFFQRIARINGNVKFLVHYTSLITGSNDIEIEDWSPSVLKSFAVSGGAYIAVAPNTKLKIGRDTLWAWNINIQTGNHDFYDRTKFTGQDIVIGRNCWIGGNVSILPGVTLGDNVTVGANTVVTKSFPSNVVIAGCPAKVIRTLEI